MLDERLLSTEKCHKVNCSQWLQGIQLLLNLTNILWSSLGLFMVLWVKLVNEEHITRGTRTGRLHKASAKSSTSQWLCSCVLHRHLEHFSLGLFSLCWPFSFSPPCHLPGSKRNWLLCLWSTSERVGWNNFQHLLILPSRTGLCSTGHVHFPRRQILKKIKSEEECLTCFYLTKYGHTGGYFSMAVLWEPRNHK